MPKPKKGGKKGNAADDDSDGDFVDPIKAASTEAQADDDVINSLPAAPPKKKKDKKKKGKATQHDESDDEDIEQKLKELALEGAKSKTPKSKKNKPTAASAFAMLGADSDGSDADSDEQSQKSDISDKEHAEEEERPQPVKKDKKSKKKKGKAAREEDEEDFDALLESVNGGAEDGEFTALPADSGDEGATASSKKDKKKNKKKQKQKKDEPKEEEDLDAILADLAIKPAGGDEKAAGEDDTKNDAAEETAAEKKRRKKQKQKEKKEAGGEEQTEVDAAEGQPADEQGEDDGGDDGNKKKRKKKKDKKSAAAEEPAAADDKKKPKNKQILAMREALAKVKEDQERQEREEEEKAQKLAEAKRLRDEEKRQKEEAKKRQREKEKERMERKKKEGTLLTPQQKADRQRALQLLAARGIELPKPGEKPKKPYYGKPKKNKQPPKSADNTITQNQEEFKGEGPKIQVPIQVTEAVAEEKKPEPAPEVKETWEADSDGDAWDAESDADEKPAATVDITEEQSSATTPSTTAEPPAAVEESSSDEEDEEESSDESSDEDSDEDESSSEEEDLTPRERALNRINKRQEIAEKNKSTDKLRAPVVCVLGHVDTGKTKILDKLRRTNVQDGEAGGITQQIGATNVPLDAIHKQTSFVKDFDLEKLKVPGLLIIDTPGHESFSNLRTRGSSLCDIAILVIDIMHGLEPQTLESIQLLKKGKTPFVVALNKIDRLYGWKPSPHQDVQAVIKKQPSNTKSEFDQRTAHVITQLAEQSLNAALYYENPNPKEYISLVPTSAHSGDGMGNLIALLCHYSQTFLAKRVAITDNLQCTVMEVKALPGLGTTVDVILVNGKLRNGDVVVMPGTEGPIVTHIRELLMPEPMKELRVKSQFRHHKEVEAAQGVKIVGKELDKVLAGLPMYVAKYQDEVEVYKEWIASALKNVLNAIKLSSTGVFVQASTLGSMEALLEYLRSVKVPYAGINIGPVHKKDVMKASVMIEHGEPQYATILAFDVKVERDATELADNLGVKIFTADIIYHLFDAFTKYQEELIEKGRRENNHLKVFPCKCRILPQFIFNSRDPIIMGVCIEAGFLANGTPICVPSKEFTQLGIVTSIERENKPIERATKGMEVCIKIENLPGQAPRLYGRHFDETDMLVSKISRESIDAVKKYWKKDMSKDDWRLIIELKKTFEIL